MRLIVPISYFRDSPRSELWRIDIDTQEIECWQVLRDSSISVRGKGVTGIVSLGSAGYAICDFNRLMFMNIDGSIRQTLVSSEMNDLHAVSVTTNNCLLLSNTGRDAVEWIDSNLNIKRHWDGLTKEQWEKRLHGKYEISGAYYDEPSLDLPFNLRRLPDTHHINFALQLPDGRSIGSSFKHRCYINLANSKAISQTLPHPIHDGFLYGGALWITTVSGVVYEAKLDHFLQFNPVFDLFDKAPFHGWCRGLYITENNIFVGVTAIVEASSRTSWLKQNTDKTRTGVYQLSKKNYSIEHFYDLSHKNGAKLFSFTEAALC